MADHDNDELRRLFDLAVAASPAERAAILDRACRGDDGLRKRIEAMIVGAEDDNFLAEPTIEYRTEPPAAQPIAEGPGMWIGRYRLLEQIGEGGFGTVFVAEQREPVARRVALKIIKVGMDSPQVVARFEQERQALALMEHPNIARVLDAGTTASGRPYFVMDLVKGVPITQYCDRKRLRIEERLALFVDVCMAVQHAHTKGIIHRDLKPSNVLVSTLDDRPSAKIIDFGIAKATQSRLTDRTLFTEHRQLVGTPEYMSPEQAEGSLDIDTRTDVYSLGVLLYELITGSTPFRGSQLHQAAYGEIQRIIRETEPPRPSALVSESTDSLTSVAAQRHVEPRRLSALIRGELDWIVMKPLEKDRSRRYQTARSLALDIERYLSGEAVEAGPPSAAYRLRKFLRRNRGPVTTAIGIVLTLLVGLVIAIWQARVAQRERKRAEGAELEARTALAGYRQMKDFPLVEDLLDEAERDLWPAHPDKISAMDDWLRRARSVAGRAAGHRDRLARLRSEAEPLSPEVERKLARLATLEKELDAKRRRRDTVAAGAGSSAAARRQLPELVAELAGLMARVRELEAETRRKRWQFASYENRFLHRILADLVAKIDQLSGAGGVIARIEARRDRAATIGARSLEACKEAWARARTAVARSADYRGMPALEPQLGLMPLGPDPQSRLEEFVVLDTGAVPERNAGGRLQCDAGTAIVLVLIPPGTFSMGAQSVDPDSPNYDPQAEQIESPVHEVKIDAFFLAKHELTQGQWLRVMAANPSVYPPGTSGVTLQHPVENVSWREGSEAMRRLGLTLPTEAQWEYAARAGTTTAWWTGAEKPALQGAANLADRYCRENGGSSRWSYDLDLDDGHVIHAPVGSYRANAFGLQDVIGNVWEWCLSPFIQYAVAREPGDARREAGDVRLRVNRGGSWAVVASDARCSFRGGYRLDYRSDDVGLRPARVVLEQ